MLLILGLGFFLFLLFSGNTNKSDRELMLLKEIYKRDSVIKVLSNEVIQWNDHARRMQRITGMPEDKQMTWVDKVSHPINTKKLLKYNPNHYWTLVDSANGTWKKPQNYDYE